jgi:hypothetical protein
VLPKPPRRILRLVDEDGRVVVVAQQHVPRALDRLDQRREGIHAVAHVRHADAQQDQERQHKKQQQPNVGHGDDEAPPEVELKPGGDVFHRRD